MKKVLLSLAIGMLSLTTALAQHERMKEQHKEQIESFRIAFFTKKLELTPDESKAFWPLYNDFEKKEDALRDKYNLHGKSLELMSDEEVKNHVMNQLELNQKLTDLRKDFTLQLMEVLPVRKVAMLHKVSREFKKELIKQLRKRRKPHK